MIKPTEPFAACEMIRTVASAPVTGKLMETDWPAAVLTRRHC